jgi:hypothetical protein
MTAAHKFPMPTVSSDLTTSGALMQGGTNGGSASETPRSSVHESGRDFGKDESVYRFGFDAVARLRAEARPFDGSARIPPGASRAARRRAGVSARLAERGRDARASARESIPRDRVRGFTTAPERHKRTVRMASGRHRVPP